MDSFCGSEFWNFTKLWEVEDPDFTICFEQTVLIWIPCAFLFLWLGLEYWYLKNSFARNIPWSFWNVSKLLMNALLIALTLLDLAMAVKYSLETEKIFPVHIWTPVIKTVTFTVAAYILLMNKKHGLQASGLLFLFWLALAVLAIPQVRTESMTQPEDGWATYQFYSYMLYFGYCWCMVALNCFADVSPTQSQYKQQEKPCPEYGASYLNRLVFGYFDSLVWTGYKRPLVQEDVWAMRFENMCNEITPTFLRHWTRLVEAAGKATKLYTDDCVGYISGTEKVKLSGQKPVKRNASIIPAIFKSFGATFLFGSMLKLISDLLVFLMPQLLRQIIGFVGDDSQPLWKGVFYAVAMFVVSSTQTLLVTQQMTRMLYVGFRIRTALVAAIYRKSLIISNTARKVSTVGEIVNLMAVDAQSFIELTIFINLLWSAPLQIGLALYFLWQILGPSVLAGLVVMIVLIPVNGFIASKTKTLQVKQMKHKDERVKMMNEVLNGVKVLKLYAWEPSFEKKVLGIRQKEIDVLKKTAYFGASTNFIWICAPFMVSLATFATYVMVDEEHELTPVKTFVSLSLFNILHTPLVMFPMLITSFIQTAVSVKRINKFMNSEELDPDNVEHDESEKSPILIQNGVFCWDEDETTLRNINMRVEKNQLVAVVGPVGSGKSSLLSALLGEMEKVSGRVNRCGTVAYVSQQAWIQNATLQDNILFGKPLDRKRYERVVEACALKPDFDMLPGGDQTEIGEKGINLSGGQKQRVALARAVYQDAEIYFLDDPLSAVDSHVGKHIFDQVIGPTGLLNGSTRILVTHGITYLPRTDKIFVLSGGEISESGSYPELMDKKGAFAEFLLQHIQETTEDAEVLEALKKQLVTETVDEDLRRRFERAISTVSQTRSDSASDTGSTRDLTSSSDSLNELRRRGKQAEDKKEVKGEKLIEAETSETGSVSWDVYKHYLKHIGWTLSITTFLLNITFQALSVGSDFWLSRWSSDVRANETKWRNIYLVGYGCLGFGKSFFNLLSSIVFRIAAVNAAALIHALLLHSIIRAPMAFFDTTPLGRILARFSSDIQTVDMAIPYLFESLILMGLSVISTLALISATTPMFMTVIIPIGFIYYFVQRLFVATSRQLKRLESITRSPIYTHFSESLTGSQTIRACEVQDRFIRESDEKVDENQSCTFLIIVANRWLAIRLEMVGNFIIFFAALFAVLDRDSTNPTSTGLVGLSLSYAMQITQILNWLVRATADVETNIVAVERIQEYGRTEPEAPWELQNETVKREWPEDGRVVFEDYQVRYRDGLDLVLHGVSFTVQGGEKVGIVGRTGAGKSSLTLSLFRIIEAAAGRIMIDGLDIANMGLHTLRSRLTIIPQDPVLFSGSLRMNLDPFEKYSDDEIWKALENAHLKAFVKGLAAGLNHEISEGGDNLSVGQRQLICLARALLRKTKVLILDEATAAVDLETDDLIQATIRQEFKECTILTIAHRLNTILDSDKVIVLDKGKILEFAPPQDLLRNPKSEFYSMAKDAGLVS